MIVSFRSYHANGKLLLTGEYLVMFGARALAIPVQYGQSMQITEYSHQNKIIWIAREMENVWFTAVYSAQTLELEYCSDLVIGFRLQKILLETKKMNPLFIRENSGYHIDNHINFNRSWGLGTSSTLLANIANWASVNPFLLHQRVSQGSGYDIACAVSDSAIVYQKIEQNPVIEMVQINPRFWNNLYFIYLERKQDSALSIERIIEGKSINAATIVQISELTDEFLKADSIAAIESIIREHEKLISTVTNLPPIQDTLFMDFPGTTKSLGAWGGDFIMAVTTVNRNTVEQYFLTKGFPVVIPFHEMILKRF